MDAYVPEELAKFLNLTRLCLVNDYEPSQEIGLLIRVLQQAGPLFFFFIPLIWRTQFGSSNPHSRLVELVIDCKLESFFNVTNASFPNLRRMRITTLEDLFEEPPESLPISFLSFPALTDLWLPTASHDLVSFLLVSFSATFNTLSRTQFSTYRLSNQFVACISTGQPTTWMGVSEKTLPRHAPKG